MVAYVLPLRAVLVTGSVLKRIEDVFLDFEVVIIEGVFFQATIFLMFSSVPV